MRLLGKINHSQPLPEDPSRRESHMADTSSAQQQAQGESWVLGDATFWFSEVKRTKNAQSQGLVLKC